MSAVQEVDDEMIGICDYCGLPIHDPESPCTAREEGKCQI